MSRRQRLLTGPRLMALLAVSAVALLAGIQGRSIFSPGPLNARASETSKGGVFSHAELDRQCGACHAPPWRSATMTQRCLSCHADVMVQLEDNRRAHGIAVSGPKITCMNGCHTEHRSRP